jgi:hypothetical protein
MAMDSIKGTAKTKPFIRFINVATSTGRIVSIRNTDLWINATDILIEAGLDKKARERVWRTLRERDIPMAYNVQEGLNLCNKYGLVQR